jgi:hypothetical protein
MCRGHATSRRGEGSRRRAVCGPHVRRRPSSGATLGSDPRAAPMYLSGAAAEAGCSKPDRRHRRMRLYRCRLDIRACHPASNKRSRPSSYRLRFRRPAPRLSREARGSWSGLLMRARAVCACTARQLSLSYKMVKRAQHARHLGCALALCTFSMKPCCIVRLPFSPVHSCVPYGRWISLPMSRAERMKPV